MIPKNTIPATSDLVYYSLARMELVKEVPFNTGAVLEVGCGTGNTGARLKTEGRASSVTGIEIVEVAANQAHNVLDQVLIGNVEAMKLPFKDNQFQAILFGDVLEHLIDPWKALANITKYLSPDGLVVASIPNIRNWKVLFPLLLKGEFQYQPTGIMDRTHLRFFTRKGMIRLMKSAGLDVIKVLPVAGGKSRYLFWLPFRPLKELIAPQYVLVCRKAKKV